jgi:serine/threonine protein kinase/Tol biopolymer transport system component
MALQPGAQLGPYEIVSAMDASGAGEVYQARDTRLDRTVAIRILPSFWTGHPELKQRLEAEAKVIAGLQHPHIRTLHDIGRERPHGAAQTPADGQAPVGEVVLPSADEAEVDFVVLEHLEGETVADRLARAAGASSSKKSQAFRVDQAVTIATQIADALDKAHQQGLVHRGLTPASIFLVRGGSKSDPPVAKLLDLGVAEPEVSGAREAMATVGASQGATPSLLTTKKQIAAQGTLVGPIEYLAPEQIEGKPADPRTDLFAFGVILYEMLTGKKAFEGKSRAVLMAAVMTAEPDPLLAAQPHAPVALDHVLKRCLAKDPDDRWQTAHDLLIQLRWITGSGAVTSAVVTARERRQQWLMRAALGAAVVVAVALVSPLTTYLRGSSNTEPFQFRTPVVGLNNADISISPDGRLLAFMARPNAQQPSSLFVRPVGSLDSRRLAGTDDATQPFWSPDSRYIGFAAGGKLKKVEAVGGPPQEIADAQGFSGGAWNQSGTIVFGTPKGLFSVSAEGGKAAPLTTVEKPETGHVWPRFLPDGRHYIYLAWAGEATNRALFIGTLDSKNRSRLMAAETNVAYASSGHLVFHREATVFAQPFDNKKLAFSGDAVQIAGGVAYDPASGRGYFDVSQNDLLIYFQGDIGGAGPVGRGQTAPNMQLGWIGRTGQLISGAGDPAQQGDFDVSPDGKFIAVTRQEGTGGDIWIIDWQRAGNATRLTLDPGDDVNPVWSSDGTRVAFTTYRKGNADIYVKNANGVGADVPILESASNEVVKAWSHDGKYIAYLFGQDNFLDIYALPQFGDKKPFPVVQGRYQKNEPQFSFDGKWLAYTSDESGMFEVYVVSFPAPDQKLKVSRDGGGQPRWRGDGRELYYRTLTNSTVMAVDITAGTKIEAGVPHVLVQPSFNGPMTREPTRHQLYVSPDGQQFLVRVAPGQVQAGRSGGGTPQAPTVFDPSTGQAGGRGNLFFNGGVVGGGAGRGFAGGAAGLTIIGNWTKVQAQK